MISSNMMKDKLELKLGGENRIIEISENEKNYYVYLTIKNLLLKIAV